MRKLSINGGAVAQIQERQRETEKTFKIRRNGISLLVFHFENISRSLIIFLARRQIVLVRENCIGLHWKYINAESRSQDGCRSRFDWTWFEIKIFRKLREAKEAGTKLYVREDLISTDSLCAAFPRNSITFTTLEYSFNAFYATWISNKYYHQ